MDMALQLYRMNELLNVHSIELDTYDRAKDMEREILGQRPGPGGNEKYIEAEQRLLEFYTSNLDLQEREVISILNDRSVFGGVRERAIRKRNQRVEVYRQLIENLGKP
ncbi:MAG: hypothetical protein HY367_02520 [Candidatus Aenigmarchaeota archaeon]|nr:hypothetical protein [Candidatus Aenigmarchaeota archaeon]